MGTSLRNQRVVTIAGTVVGFAREEVVHWRSIPYARPPVGPLRLRAPQRPVPWTGARYCDEFGFAPPQRRVFTVPPMGRFQATNEDCLTLNVIAPAEATGEPLPVMFYIPGGAYVLGTSAIYNGAPLVRRGCVYVSVNYRVGALGCMTLSSLSTPDITIDSNLFLRDLVMALQWVRDNIGGFGGDPDNVTIFGESAGAHAVATLLAVPQAEGLFVRAIAQSTTRGLVRTADEADEAAGQLAALLGASRERGAEALMQADPARLLFAVDQMLNATSRETLGRAPFGPSIDGDYLPQDPIEAMARGNAHPVPLIIGSTADEGRAFVRMMGNMPLSEPLIEEMLAGVAPDVGARIRAAYPGYPNRDACIRLGGESFFGAESWRIAEAHSKHNPTYAYRYDYAPRTLDWLGIGPTHGTDLLPLFDVYRNRFGKLLTLAGDRRSALRVSDDLQSRWLSFARTGTPGAGWPGYGEPNRSMMIFDRKSRVESDPVAAQRLAWQEFDSDLRESSVR